MGCLVVQLSDLHLDQENKNICEKDEAILGAIRAEFSNHRFILMVLNGDLVNKGDVNGFVLCKNLIKVLNEKLTATFPASVVKWVSVPGNHDLNFSDDSRDEIRNELIDSVWRNTASLNLKSETILEITRPLNDYYAFVQSTDELIHVQPASASERLHKDVSFNLGDFVVHIGLRNTAWLGMDKVDGHGRIVHFNPMVGPTAAECEIRILVAHHPLEWSQTENRKRTTKYIETFTDMVLTGHEHQRGAYSRKSITSRKNDYIESGSLCDSDESASSFTIVDLDVIGKVYRVAFYAWNGARYTRESESDVLSIDPSPLHSMLDFKAERAYLELLSDPGANYLHRRKEALTLEDIFVYPDLRSTSTKKDVGDADNLLDGRQVVAKVLEGTPMLVKGSEKFGKSALLRKLALDLMKEGIVPILLVGNQFKRTDDLFVKRLIDRVVSEQYGPENVEAIRQLPKKEKAILIDDVDQVGDFGKFLTDCFEKLSTLHSSFVMTASDELDLGIIANQERQLEQLLKCETFQISEFGHVLRCRLIKRWLLIGQTDSDQDNHAFETRRLETALSALVGKNVVPSCPFFLLTLLVACETERENTVDAGSYGHHYEFLISSATAKITSSLDKDDPWVYNAGIFLRVLESVAVEMYERSVSEMKVSDVLTNLVNFKTQFDLRFGEAKMLRHLVEGRLLKYRDEDTIAFTYPYVYFFSIAKAFQGRMADDELETPTRERIRKLIVHLGEGENATIVAFLLHLSRDSKVLSELVSKGDAMLKGISECDLDLDVEHVEFPQPIFTKVMGENHESNRERYLRKLDKEEGESLASRKTDAEISEFNDVLVAFRCMEVSGQVVKSLAGSLIGTKKEEIVRKSCSLGLRCLQAIIHSIAKSEDEYRSGFMASFLGEEPTLEVSRRDLVSDVDRRQAVERRLANLYLQTAFGVLSRISKSVGSEALEGVITKIGQSRQDVAFRLLELKVKLDHFRVFPDKEILALAKDLAGKPCASQLLRSMVFHHMYMFYVPRAKREIVAKPLNIVVTAPRLIGGKEKL